MPYVEDSSLLHGNLLGASRRKCLVRQHSKEQLQLHTALLEGIGVSISTTIRIRITVNVVAEIGDLLIICGLRIL